MTAIESALMVWTICCGAGMLYRPLGTFASVAVACVVGILLWWARAREAFPALSVRSIVWMHMPGRQWSPQQFAGIAAVLIFTSLQGLKWREGDLRGSFGSLIGANFLFLLVAAYRRHSLHRSESGIE